MYIRRKHGVSLVTRAVFIALVFGVTAVFHHVNNIRHGKQDQRDTGTNSIHHDTQGILGRKLLAARSRRDPETGSSSHGNDADGVSGVGNSTSPGNETVKETEECTPPAYHEFPSDVFTTVQRAQGAIALHVLLVVYMFTALAIVCDVYFVASLDKICAKLNLSEDVAGATFMAAGSSAPELFTSVIGVFVAKGDVGVGTIVGSAVFNILFVIGICGILVTEVVTLTWFPLIRDSAFYMLSVIVLISSIADSKVTWYESTIMLVLYIFYIIAMKFNPYIQSWCVARIHIFKLPGEDTSTILPPPAERKYYGNYDGAIQPGTVLPQGEKSPLPNGKEIFTNEADKKPTTPPGPGQKMPMAHLGVIPVDEYVRKSTRKISFEDACFRFMKGRRFRPITRFWAAACIIICERRKLLKDPLFMKRMNMKTFSYDSEANSYTKAVRSGVDEAEEPDLADSWQRIPNLDEGIWPIFKWATTLPLCALLYYTVPDCREKRWDRWFMVTFINSIVWIAIFSYVMVWMVVLIGYTLGIPDSIMGITFLAAGTSVPDAMASVMVARQGQGDMAISNTIGSNVFDILIGLALPWWIKTSCVNPGSAVHINSNGMVFSVVLLFLTVVITLTSIQIGGWKLDKKLGAICLTSYAIFLLFSILIEFNVFGYVNPPMCSE